SMAAPQFNKAEGNESKKRIQAKTSFNSPFTSQWSQLPQEDMHFILKTLTDKMISTGLEKKEVKVFRSWGKRKEEKLPSAAESLSQETQGGELSTNGWTDVAARRQLAIGINEVTKALEKNELHLKIFTFNCHPNWISSHQVDHT
uniref:Ribosomal protein eL8/eL30/eS12/Gadd45 domain-containing protein n=1 Tax=Oryzias sinensis TaxID=183150 RepID=A0A8C7WQ08_9TELE